MVILFEAITFESEIWPASDLLHSSEKPSAILNLMFAWADQVADSEIAGLPVSRNPFRNKSFAYRANIPTSFGGTFVITS